MYETVIDEALGQYGDRASGLVKIVHKDLFKYFQEMKASIDDLNYESALISAHSSKSIYSLINVHDALKIVQEMEQLAHDKDLNRYQELYEELKPLYSKVNHHLENLIGDNQ